MIHKRSSRVFLIVLFSVLAPLAAAQLYTVTDLGPLTPAAINTWGQVVGDYNGHAFMWTRTGGMRDLGIIPGGTFSSAGGINDLGVVAGTADGPGTMIFTDPTWPRPNRECSHFVQPFVWTQRKNMEGLGTFIVPADSPLDVYAEFCGVNFITTGINALRQVVGYNIEVATYQYAFLWTRTGGMTLLTGPNFGNWPPTFALAINNTGQMVGQSSTFHTCGIGHATSWKNGVGTDLGTLGGGPDVLDYGSSANAVNDLGVVVGWSTTGPVSAYFPAPVHAVVWTPSGGIRDLGTLPGDLSSAAIKANFWQVIGSSGNETYFNLCPGGGAPFEVPGRPFIWSETKGMQDLNTLIPPSGWVLASVADINVWGQIVGSGTYKGQTHGFLLTPRVLFQH
jgi:probable HAF family extracellular repeat protein